jgi:hypothetical protein
MTRTHSDDIRFGQDPADSERLIHAWQLTRPDPQPMAWERVWRTAQGRAAAQPPAASDITGAPWTRWAIAASLLIGLTAFALRERLSNDDRTAGITVANEDRSTEVPVEPAEIQGLAIDLGEDDALAVIRTGYEECPLPKPCVDSVRIYGAGDSGEASLASNFEMLNAFESIANE